MFVCFVSHFILFCYLDKQYVDRVTDLFFSLSLNVLVYAHVNVGVFTRTSFFLSCLLDSADGAPVDAWPYFPGFKVGQNLSLHSYYLTIGRR
jgi:hypothetical protein